MSDSSQDAERQKFELLVPFYITHNLSDQDSQFVRNYVAAHPDCGKSFDFTERLFAAVKSIGSSRDSRAVLDKLLQRYETTQRKSFLTRLLDKFHGLGLSNGVVIAMLVILAQGVGFIAHLGSDRAESAKVIEPVITHNAVLTIKSGADAGALIILIHKFGGRIVNSSVVDGARQIFIALEDKARIQTLIDLLWGAELIEAAALLL